MKEEKLEEEKKIKKKKEEKSTDFRRISFHFSLYSFTSSTLPFFTSCTFNFSFDTYSVHYCTLNVL
jgi:hypothetical protein